MSGERPIGEDEGRATNTREWTRPYREAKSNRTNGRSADTDGGSRLGELLDVLTHPRRRYVLYCLRSEERPNLEDVIRQIAAWEHDTSPEATDARTRYQVRIDLYHAQLPKLEEAGVVTYDWSDGSLEYHSLPDPVEEFLDYWAAVERPDTAD